MSEQYEMLDTLHAMWENGAAKELPPEVAALACAADAAYGAWQAISNAEGKMRGGWGRQVRPLHAQAEAQVMAATRAYVAAWDLWQFIEQLGADLLSEPAFSHTEPFPRMDGLDGLKPGKQWDGEKWVDAPPAQETSPLSHLDSEAGPEAHHGVFFFGNDGGPDYPGRDALRRKGIEY